MVCGRWASSPQTKSRERGSQETKRVRQGQRVAEKSGRQDHTHQQVAQGFQTQQTGREERHCTHSAIGHITHTHRTQQRHYTTHTHTHTSAPTHTTHNIATPRKQAGGGLAAYRQQAAYQQQTEAYRPQVAYQQQTEAYRPQAAYQQQKSVWRLTDRRRHTNSRRRLTDRRRHTNRLTDRRRHTNSRRRRHTNSRSLYGGLQTAGGIRPVGRGVAEDSGQAE